MSKHSKPKECREERETSKSNGNNAKSDLLSKKQQQPTSNNQQNHHSENSANYLSKNKFAKPSSNATSNEDWPTINETFKLTTAAVAAAEVTFDQLATPINNNNSVANSTQSACSANQETNNNKNRDKLNNSEMNTTEKAKDIGKGINKMKLNDCERESEKKLRSNSKDLLNNVNISSRDKINNNNIYRNSNDDNNNDSKDNGDIDDFSKLNIDDGDNTAEEDSKKKASDDSNSQSCKDDLLLNGDQFEDESATDNKDDLNSSSGASASGGCNDGKDSSNNNNSNLSSAGSTGGNKKKGTKQRWRPLIIEPQPNKRDQDRRKGPKSYRRRGSSLSASDHTESRRFSSSSNQNHSSTSNNINSSNVNNNDDENTSAAGVATGASSTSIKPSIETKSYRGSRRSRGGRYGYPRSHYPRTRYDYDASNIQIDTNAPCYSHNTLLECEPIPIGEPSVPLNSPSTISSSSDYKSITPYLMAGPPAATTRILQPTSVPYYIPSYPPYSGSSVTSLSPVSVDLYKLIRSQVEYYFSDENLQRDFFLRRKMDSEGYLPIQLIASFQRVQALTQDLNVLISALRTSKEIEFSDDCMRIRTSKNPLQWPVNDALSGLKDMNLPSHSFNGYFSSDLHPDVPAFIPGQPYGYGYDGAPTYSYNTVNSNNDKNSGVEGNNSNSKQNDEETNQQEQTVNTSDDGIEGDNETDNDPNEVQQQQQLKTKTASVSCYADVLKVNKNNRDEANVEVKKNLVNQSSSEIKLSSD